MNHKTQHVSLLLPLLLAMTGAYAAAPTADLSVKGQLVVPVCTVAATDDGIYNIGKQSATVVKPTANTQLASMTKAWTITCDAETYLNFSHVDNRASSASTTHIGNFGLGNVNGSGKIGFYTVVVKNPTVDGVPSRVFSTMNNSVTSTDIVPYLSIHTGNRHGWASASSIAQKSGKIFMADFEVTPTLASSSAMNGPITDDTNIDGSMTLNFAYGI